MAEQLELEIRLTGLAAAASALDAMAERVSKRFDAIAAKISGMGLGGGGPGGGGGNTTNNFYNRTTNFYSTINSQQLRFQNQYNRNQLSFQKTLNQQQLNFQKNLMYLYQQQMNQFGGGGGGGTHRQGFAGGIGRAGLAAGAAVAGMVYSGFRDTVEGERFAAQLKNLSRSLAAVFQPAIVKLTNVMGGAANYLSNLSPRSQDRAMTAGLLAAGTFGGGRLLGGGFRGYGAAALGTYAIGAGYEPARILSGMDGSNRLRSRDYDRYGYGRMDANQLDAEAGRLGKANRTISGYANSDPTRGAGIASWIAAPVAMAALSLLGKAGVGTMTLGASGPGIGDVNKANRDLEKRFEAIRIRRAQLRGESVTIGGTAVDEEGIMSRNGRKLLDTSTVGFGEIGSTARLLQEAMSKTGGDPEETTNDILKDILSAIYETAPEGSDFGDTGSAPG